MNFSQRLKADFPSWKIQFNTSSLNFTATRRHPKGNIMIKGKGGMGVRAAIEKSNVEIFDGTP